MTPAQNAHQAGEKRIGFLCWFVIVVGLLVITGGVFVIVVMFQRFGAGAQVGAASGLHFLDLSGQQSHLALSSIRGAAIRQVRTDSAERGQGDEDQRTYLNAVTEMRLRFLIGIPLLLVGIWLVYYCDRTFNRDIGWRGWFLWLSAYACIATSCILLLYRSSLSSLKDLL